MVTASGSEVTPTAGRIPSLQQASATHCNRDQNSINTIAAARPRDHTGASTGCGDTIFTTRARRPDAVIRLARSASSRCGSAGLDSFIRHCAYDFARPGDRDSHLVARDLAFDVQTTINPPQRRMPARNDADDDLQNVDDVVMALNMRPLVDQHAIQVIRIECPHERRRDGDHRRSPSEHRSARHRVRQDERGATPFEAPAAPVRQDRLQVSGKRTNVSACTADRDDRRDEPDKLDTRPHEPRGQDHDRRCPPGVGQRDNRVGLRWEECRRRLSACSRERVEARARQESGARRPSTRRTAWQRGPLQREEHQR